MTLRQGLNSFPKGCFEQNEINLVYGKYGAKKTTVMTAIANDLADKSCGGRGIDLEEDFKVLYFCSEGLPHVVDKFRKLNPMSDVEITGGYLDLGTWQQVADLAKYYQENTVGLSLLIPCLLLYRKALEMMMQRLIKSIRNLEPDFVTMA